MSRSGRRGSCGGRHRVRRGRLLVRRVRLRVRRGRLLVRRGRLRVRRGRLLVRRGRLRVRSCIDDRGRGVLLAHECLARNGLYAVTHVYTNCHTGATTTKEQDVKHSERELHPLAPFRRAEGLPNLPTSFPACRVFHFVLQCLLHVVRHVVRLVARRVAQLAARLAKNGPFDCRFAVVRLIAIQRKGQQRPVKRRGTSNQLSGREAEHGEREHHCLHHGPA